MRLFEFCIPANRGGSAFALHPFAGELAGAANGFRFLAGALFGRLFISTPELELTEDAFALHFLFQRPERLVYIVVTNRNLHS